MRVEIPQGGFRAIYADPAWKYDINKGNRGGLYSRHATEMETEDIMAIPVAKWAATNSILAMWATWAMLLHALRVIDAWGYTYRTGIFWTKLGPQGLPRGGVGYWTLGATELILFSSRGKSGVSEREDCRGLTGLLTGEDRVFWSPRGEHSAKPIGMHRYLKSFEGPHLELFARHPMPGWVTWGGDLGFWLGPDGVSRCPVSRLTQLYDPVMDQNGYST